MNVYRIYVGSPHTVEVACSIVQGYFDGFTCYKGTGYWKGSAENTLIFEVCTEAENERRVIGASVELRRAFKQECVMWTKTACEVHFEN
jgi:hypothetical protein